MRVHIPDSRHVFYKEGYGQDTFVGAGNRRIGSLVLKLLDDREPLETQVFCKVPTCAFADKQACTGITRRFS